ncbi:MAG: helix-turn-helix transcriptional regulator [Sarcina sp.]
MSKINNIVRMMFMLKSGRLISRKEVAEKLEVNPKEVIVYKKALDEIFEIESIRGPHGGYKLVDTYFPFKAVLTETEVLDLKMLVNKLEYSEDENEKLKKVVDKINFSILNNENTSSADIIPYSRRNKGMYNEDVELKIYQAILDRVVIIIEYTDNKNKVSRRRVEPYKYFIYRGESYLIANCLEKNDIRFFKFIRIKDCIVTSFKFERTVDIESILENMKTNGLGVFGLEEYDLELEISPPMANSIKERIWVENQEIIELENGKILFKARMKGEHSIVSWILTMREFVKINKPEKLQEVVMESIDRMLQNHKNNN